MNKFGLYRRFNSFEVEMLTNGFVLQLSGKDEDDNYKQTKTYCADLQQLSEFIADVIALPEG
jgi:hypothetical protein